jgi:hypothetical protein
MAREKVGSRELSSIEQTDMNEVKELMAVVNSNPPFSDQAKETFRVAVVGCGAAMAMVNKFILNTDERVGLLNALRDLVGSLKVS